MIIGLLSDAHGHVEGFRAGLGLLRRLGADRIFFLGDAVGYLPGAGVVEAIAAEDVRPIAGNHEAMLLDVDGTVDDDVFRLDETRRELGVVGMQRVAAWPRRRVLDPRVGPVLLVHDRPSGGRRYIYPDTDLAELGSLPWRVVCMGHTHRPFVRHSRSTTFVNVGSCGLPRDDGHLGAVATLDTVTGEARISRFDLRAAHRRALTRVGPVHQVVRASMDRRNPVREAARPTHTASRKQRTR
jgi:predicted phosphodiesterase